MKRWPGRRPLAGWANRKRSPPPRFTWRVMRRHLSRARLSSSTAAGAPGSDRHGNEMTPSFSDAPGEGPVDPIHLLPAQGAYQFLRGKDFVNHGQRILAQPGELKVLFPASLAKLAGDLAASIQAPEEIRVGPEHPGVP